MRKLLKIGQKEFKFKKEALAYYKSVLNSYSFGESLNDSDYKAVIALLAYDYLNCLAEDEILEQDDEDVISKNSTDESEDSISIIDIQVAQVQFNTKCFEVFFSDDMSEYISYIMLINNKKYDQKSCFMWLVEILFILIFMQ